MNLTLFEQGVEEFMKNRLSDNIALAKILELENKLKK